MKKFFALMLTMAMVMSLFSGIVLAADATGATALKYSSGLYRAAVNTETTLSLTYTNPTYSDVASGTVSITYSFGTAGNFFKLTSVGVLPAGWTATMDATANTVVYTGTVAGKTVVFKPTVKTPVSVGTVDAPITFTEKVGNTTSAVKAVTSTVAMTTGYDISLNYSNVTVGQSVALQGIITEGGKKPAAATIYWAIFAPDQTTVVASGTTGAAQDGVFVTPAITMDKEGYYRLVLSTTATPTTSSGDAARGVGYKSMTAKYAFTLDNPGTVNLGEVKVLTGKVEMFDAAQGKNVGAGNVDIYEYVYSDTDADWIKGTKIGTTGADGSFAVLKKFSDVADYKIGTAFYYASIVSLAQKSATLTTAEKLTSIPGQVNELSFKLVLGKTDEGDDITATAPQGENIPGSTRITLTGLRIKDAKTAWEAAGYTVDPDRSTWITAIGNAAAHYTKLVLTYTGSEAANSLPITLLDKGALTVKAEYIPTSTVGAPDYVATKTVDVVGADEFNAGVNIFAGLTEVEADELLANTEYTFKVNAYDKDGNRQDGDAANKLDKVVVTFEGPGVEKDEVESVIDEVISVPMTLNAAGHVTITIQGTFDNGTKTAVITKTYDIEGYTVILSSDEGTVDANNAITLAATVVDAAGIPVNNAKVVFKANHAEAFTVQNANDVYTVKTDEIVVNGASKNVSGGVYSKSVKLNNAADVTVSVFKTEIVNNTVNQDKLMATTDFVINGQAVYTVTATEPTVLAGIPEAIAIKVTDANGNAVTSGVTFKVKALTDVAGDESISDLANLGYTLENGSFKFPNVVANRKGEYKITASTNNGNKMGQVVVTAVNPVLEMNVTSGMVTENVKDLFEVKVIDPRTNTEIAAQLKVAPVIGTNSDDVAEGDTATVAVYTADKNGKFVDVAASGLLGASEEASAYTFKVLAASTELMNSSTDEVYTAKVRIRLVGEDKTGATIYNTLNTFTVTPAEIKVTPETIYANALNAVTLTYVDAHGNALSDRKVSVPGILTDVLTDANGQVSFSILPNATSAIKMTAQTDVAGKLVEKTLSFAADTVKPVLTINVPATVKTSTVTVTGTVTDNVKADKVYVNGAQVFVFDGAFETEVALKLGANTIKVHAFDAAGNGAQELVTVKYVLPTIVKLGIGSTDATIDGGAASLDVPAYVKAGRTMVPYRFIGEALGAAVNYADNAGIQTVTVSHGGHTVVLTIGSTTALVNGETVTLDAAPEIVNGRTMVPARFVAESLGAVVDWNGATNAVTIVY